MRNPISYFVRSLLAVLACSLCLPVGAAERGELTGGAVHVAPSWFKESFLEIADDVDEATEEGRHVLLFFQLNGCPYCDRMLTESFETAPVSNYIQEHFDSIAINVRGDRDIAFNEEISVTEKELSELLKVRATPAILFLDANNKTVARVNGYRAPARFEKVLNYVQSKAYENSSLAEYLDQNLPKDVYTLREHPIYQPITDLASVKGPLAVVFEDGSCLDCDEFYDRMLSRDDVLERLGEYTVVRLDAASGETITDPQGNTTTPREMALKLDMFYRPGVLLFDQGELIRRHDSLPFTHHFKESMLYVSGGSYKNEEYGDFSERRTEELLAAGININLSE